MDAASLLALLVELHQKMRRRLGGVGLDYVKCFDLVPQAVVLRLALEQGMDPGTCRALAGMYAQLRRCFKVTGALGSWFRATNGII